MYSVLFWIIMAVAAAVLRIMWVTFTSIDDDKEIQKIVRGSKNGKESRV